MEKRLQLSLLGVPQIEIAGVSLVEALSSKAQAILYYLAVTGQPQSRATLATLLWGDMPEAAARANLRRTLVDLRRTLGNYLEIDRHSVAFKPERDIWIDVVEFKANVLNRPSRSVPSSPAPDLEPLQVAVELYRDDFLTGFYALKAPDFETWLLAEQARLRELVIQTLRTLADHHAEQGDLAQGITYTHQLLNLEPWREEAHHQLMLLLARDGQRSAALAQYETCRQMLAEELGVEPGREMVALYERIREGKLSRGTEDPRNRKAEKQESKGATFTPAPLHPSGAAVQQAQTPPHNLPTQPTPFVGRKKELVDIIRRLTDRDCRLLTLVGPGGIGKTRLALQTAQSFIDIAHGQSFFRHGLIFVPLAAVESINEMVAAIAEAANFTFYSNGLPKQQLLDYLQEKEMLLVLDNLEHLLSPVSGEDKREASPESEVIGAAELIAEILAVAPGVKILVTSREALNLQEAWFHLVEGMSFPVNDQSIYQDNGAESNNGAISLEKYDAVKLFAQCAQRAKVTFSLAQERAHVARICQLVEGMPLAIELAVAWLKASSTEKIVKEIERSLDILSSRLQNIPARHRSIRAVFEHSWQLLAKEDQAILKQLSVFRGSFDQTATEQIAGASLLNLAKLVEKSLLRVTQMGRYQMHELLRQFAAGKLAEMPQEKIDAQERHSVYYLDFLEKRKEILTGTAQQTAVAEISEDIENVRAAWLWAIEQNDLAAIDQVLAGYFNFYLIRSRFQEGEETFAHVLNRLRQVDELADQPKFDIVRARALIRRGTFCYFLGDYERANQYVEKGLRAGLDSEYQSDVAFAHLVLGVVAGWQGKKEIAEQQLYRSLAISQDIDDKENMVDALHELALIRGTFGDYAEAKRLAQESLTLGRAQGRPDWVAHALVSLGWATVCLGEYVEAEVCYQEALSIFETLGSRHGIADVLDSLGWVAWCKGGKHLEKAREYFDQSLTMMREIGHRRLITNTLCDLAILANELEDYDKAQAYSREGLYLADELDSSIYKVSYLSCLGKTAYGFGDYAESRRYLGEALQIAYNIQLLPSLTFVLFEFAILFVKESDATHPHRQTNMQMKALALELLTFVIHHSATWQGVRDRATPLQTALEAELPVDVAALAKKQGTIRTLEAVVTGILGEENTPQQEQNDTRSSHS